MDEITTHVVTDLSDAKLRDVAVRIAKAFRLAAEKAVANFSDPRSYPIPADPNSLEQVMLSRFRQLKEVQQKRSVLKVMSDMSAARGRQRFYGDLAGVNMRSATPILDQVGALTFPAALKFPLSHLEDLAKDPSRLAPVAPVSPITRPEVSRSPIEVVTTDTKGTTPVQPVTLTGPAPMKSLELRLHHVKCIEETDGFLWSSLGEDEIDLGGLTINPAGTTTKISPFHVGDFDTDDVVTYAQTKRFALFSLADGKTWPKMYFATMVMAEIDNGGFPDFLKTIYEKAKQWALTTIGTAVGAALGAGLGAIIGAVVGFVLDLLFGWLVSIWEDDVFPPVTIMTVLKSATSRFAGNKTDSPDHDAYFEAFGGKYRVRYDWHLLA